MIKYKSLINKIAPFILAGGLAGLTAGCNDKWYVVDFKTQPAESQAYTNEILGLGTTFRGNNYAVYANQKGKVETVIGGFMISMYRDLPDNSKPVIVSRGLKKTIHIPSNSTFRIPKNEHFAFELELNKDGQIK